MVIYEERSWRAALAILAGIILSTCGCGGEANRSAGSPSLPEGARPAPPGGAPLSVTPGSTHNSPQPLIGENDPPLPKTVPEIIEEAAHETDRLVEAFPYDPDALEIKARVQFLLGKYDVAVDCWELALELDPQYAYAYHGLGLVAARNGDYEKAAAHQRKALERAPGFSDAVHELSDALLKQGELQGAGQVLEDHLQVTRNPRRVLIRLGQIHLLTHDFERANAAFQAVLEREPNVSQAHFGAATALARLGRGEEAAVKMERYRALNSEKRDMLSQLRAKSDDLNSRIVDFATRYGYASRVYLAHGATTEALRLSRRAAQLHPIASNHAFLGQVFEAAGDRVSALRAFSRAIELEPGNEQYRQMLEQLQEGK